MPLLTMLCRRSKAGKPCRMLGLKKRSIEKEKPSRRISALALLRGWLPFSTSLRRVKKKRESAKMRGEKDKEGRGGLGEEEHVWNFSSKVETVNTMSRETLSDLQVSVKVFLKWGAARNASDLNAWSARALDFLSCRSGVPLRSIIGPTTISIMVVMEGPIMELNGGGSTILPLSLYNGR